MDNSGIGIGIVDANGKANNSNRSISITNLDEEINHLGKDMGKIDIDRGADNPNINTTKVDIEINDPDIKTINVNRANNLVINAYRKADE